MPGMLTRRAAMGGNVVQHFNSDGQRPARFVGVQPYLDGLGADLGSSLEQLEDAP